MVMMIRLKTMRHCTTTTTGTGRSVESIKWSTVGRYRVDVASFESLALPELQVRLTSSLISQLMRPKVAIATITTGLEATNVQPSKLKRFVVGGGGELVGDVVDQWLSDRWRRRKGGKEDR
ncbi:unnamed protein product [Lactuca saligna]|uniref:Uncharacterized protein n=1 Tax=Lactuca saligna TaxID=75948 RepID=A0AA35V8V6_LACSI|nr:unnamed protein product [Lactuca saligna]